MAPPTGAHVMRNAIVTLAGTNCANQVTKIRLVPDTPIQTLRTLVPDGTVTDVDSTVWVLELAGCRPRDRRVPARARGRGSVRGHPAQGGYGQETASCTVICVPVEWGGEQGSFRTFEVELPVVGAPVFGVSDES